MACFFQYPNPHRPPAGSRFRQDGALRFRLAGELSVYGDVPSSKRRHVESKNWGLSENEVAQQKIKCLWNDHVSYQMAI